MSESTHTASFDKAATSLLNSHAGRIERILDRIEEIRREIDGPVFLDRRERHHHCLDLSAALDDLAKLRLELLRGELHAALPSISGGAPDDGETWPTEWSEDLDGYSWEPAWDGPLPLDVLEADAPRFEPSAEDWADYHAHLDGRLTEEDHVTAHGCV